MSALKITQWFMNHFISKVESTREPTGSEKLLTYLEDNLVNNGSYEFRQNDIIKKGPYSLRRSERLMSALNKLEAEGVVQLFKRGGTNYVKLTNSKMEVRELAEKTNTPLLDSGSLTMSKLPIPE